MLHAGRPVSAPLVHQDLVLLHQKGLGIYYIFDIQVESQPDLSTPPDWHDSASHRASAMMRAQT